MAQDVLAPPPIDFSGLSPALVSGATNQPGFLPLTPSPPTQDQALLKLGPADFRPHFLYRFLYGDGISAAPGQHLTTAINEIYPGILIRLGNHWVLDYTPILSFYSNNQFRDTFNNSVALSWASIYKDWTLSFSQTYVSSSDPLVQTGAQTDQETFLTALNAIYQISSPLSLELSARQNFQFYEQNNAGEQLSDVKTWYTLDWLNYQFSPQFGAAFGLGFGYDDVQHGPNMPYEQLWGRVKWAPGQKLFVSLSGGVEDRQFIDSDASDLVNPLLNLSAQYRLFEPTTLSVGAARTVASSTFPGQINENFSVTGQLKQRLLGKLYLDLIGGYFKTDYKSTVEGIAAPRADHGTFFTARLSLLVIKRGMLAVLYQMSENSSTQGAFSYTSNQVGFELGYKF
jgi:hypothetical protein